MCGPLALSFNMQGRGNAGANAFLYNISRTAAYMLLGLIFGAIGLSFSYAGLQQAASFVMGVMILLILLFNWLGKSTMFRWAFWQRYTHAVKQQMAHAFSGNKTSHIALLGFFNGLLPCGLVYLALAGAVATGGIGSGTLYMMFFGLGTVPLMFSFAAFGSYMGTRQRFFIRKYLPAFSFIVAVLLILRGLNLGIPYVSPYFDAHTRINNNEAHQLCYPPAEESATEQ